jgi:Heme/copper-type cytochrome/quinol oxidases, subunit 2
VTLQSFEININPPVSLKPGDTATFNFTTLDHVHGFELDDPTGKKVITGFSLQSGAATVSRTVTLTVAGTYNYFCTVSTCGSGHSNMQGSFVVGTSTVGGPPGY